MAGFIANTDSEWFRFVTTHEIRNPVFWYKRSRNPSSKAIVAGNYFFMRITGTKPPVIRAVGSISELATVTVQKAFDKYGNRMGYESIDSMIDFSSRWRSGVNLAHTTRIFCVAIENLKLIRPIRMDKELEPLGIVFDHQHIITGKGLTAEQTSALLQIAKEGTPVKSAQDGTEGSALGQEAEPPLDDDSPSEAARFLESHMQWFVFNNLKSLGIPGVTLFEPDTQRDTQGKFRTDEVGEIDFLLRTSGGDLYVVEIKKAGTDKTVGQICRYMGWVKHRLAKRRENVYGIIVTQDYDHRLSYAASVVKNLSVKRIQVSFTIRSEAPELPD